LLKRQIDLRTGATAGPVEKLMDYYDDRERLRHDRDIPQQHQLAQAVPGR
jgi:hypothetical protein